MPAGGVQSERKPSKMGRLRAFVRGNADSRPTRSSTSYEKPKGMFGHKSDQNVAVVPSIKTGQSKGTSADSIEIVQSPLRSVTTPPPHNYVRTSGAIDSATSHTLASGFQASQHSPPSAVAARGGHRSGHSLDLADEISQTMRSNTVGVTKNSKTEYLPDAERARLVTTTNIRRTLGPASYDIAIWIEKHASKIFVITVLAFSEESKRLEAMRAFYEHHFKDTNLPVKYLPNFCEVICDTHNRTDCRSGCNENKLLRCKGKHRRRSACFHHQVWSLTAFKRFFDYQWGLLLQSFKRATADSSMPRLRIMDDVKLPFLEEDGDNAKRRGLFGEVRAARMLHKYQDTIPATPGCDTINVAIKTLQDVDAKGFNIKQEWDREVAAHQVLGLLDENHLVRAIAAYEHCGEYHLLFEWADGGNLRDHWSSTDHDGLSPELVREYLTQLRGLTSALSTMHNTEKARSRSGSSANSSRDGDVPSAVADATAIAAGLEFVNSSPEPDGSSDESTDEDSAVGSSAQRLDNPAIVVHEDPSPIEPLVTVRSEETTAFGEPLLPSRTSAENWRHGDIKPENILRFSEQSSRLGTLKLADLGRSKRHFTVTQDRPEREADRWRTKPYEPPDLYINNIEQNMSRLYDVWSLGCVFFESILWILYGREWLKDFIKTTESATQKQTPFWIKKQDRAEMSPVVEACMDHIFAHDPECKDVKSSAIKDLLTLVRYKMLVIDLPERTEMYSVGKRANTETILAGLDVILSESGKDDYCQVHRPRKRGAIIEPASPVPQVPAALPVESGTRTPREAPRSLLRPPSSPLNGRSRTQQAQTYSGAPENKWQQEDDEAFATQTYRSNTSVYSATVPPVGINLCERCLELDFRERGLHSSRKLESLVGPATSCKLCALLLSRCKVAVANENTDIMLNSKETLFTLSWEDGRLTTTLRFRLCRALGNITHLRDAYTVHKNADHGLDGAPVGGQHVAGIPLGLPKLLDLEDDASFVLLRSWLEDCNHNHTKTCAPMQASRYVPKRLLFVGGVDETHSRIIESKTLDKVRGQVKYLALSHPWGTKSRQNRHFVSTIDNIEQHMHRITDAELPQNFCDAVEVARQLEVSYLWIDALCILQTTDSHPGDFQEEAGFMQEIFSSAYCVLAASSATGMNSGFLTTGHDLPRLQRQAIEVDAGASGARIFMCDSPNDFQHDVLDSPLNSRAWVLQERALARRTIFFTNNQMYWECSNGVRCETMAKLKNSEAAFLGDSNFPSYAVRDTDGKDTTKGARISLFKSLYTNFCSLGFSRATDKPFAISGLEQRLTDRFEDTSGAGVFGKHQGRCLLWWRADDVKALERIDFGNANPGTHKPPSWSFMAHIGGISYVDIPPRTVDWVVPGLKLTGTPECSWLFADDPLTFLAEARDFVNSAAAVVTYDIPTGRRDKDKCVVIGKSESAFCYVLVVRPTQDASVAAERQPYERAGAGYLPVGALRKGSIRIEIV